MSIWNILPISQKEYSFYLEMVSLNHNWNVPECCLSSSIRIFKLYMVKCWLFNKQILLWLKWPTTTLVLNMNFNEIQLWACTNITLLIIILTFSSSYGSCAIWIPNYYDLYYYYLYSKNSTKLWLKNWPDLLYSRSSTLVVLMALNMNTIHSNTVFQ